jgi:thiol:disulfide interchange protein
MFLRRDYMLSRRNFIFFLLPLSLLACQFITSAQERTSTPAETQLPAGSVLLATSTNIPEQTIAPASKPSGLTIVALKPSDGDLNAQLANQSNLAKGLNQMPVVDFTATWCPACVAIAESLAAGDQRMLDAFDGVYLIEVDVDEWAFDNWDQGNYGFKFDGIPVFFKLDEQGKQTGEVIDGNAWGDNIPENIAPPMDNFFHP